MYNTKKVKNKYYSELKFHGNDEKLRLTQGNAEFIEAVLMIDSRYKNSTNPEIRPNVKYIDYLAGKEKKYNETLKHCGSSAFWIKQLVEILESQEGINHKVKVKLENKKKNNETIEEEKELDLNTILYCTVCAIDRENATHLSAHKSKEKVGRKNVTNKLYNLIVEKGTKAFKDMLLRDNDFYLVGYITVPKEPEKENYHYSFATKFCKYVSRALNSDKYYIYDNVIITSIGYYIKKSKLDKKYTPTMLEFEKDKYKTKSEDVQYREISELYQNLHKCLDDIRKSEKEEERQVSRDSVDHIIWYSNK